MNRMTRDKAMHYAKYRLPFSIEATKYVIDIANVSEGVVADIGAGTGLLTKHFVGNVKKVFVIEPDFEMRELAKELIGERKDVEFQDGLAENTNLLAHSIDLIVAANAYHRFQPESTIKEFKRILKPNGMLAVFSYYDDSNFFRDTLRVCNDEQYVKRLTESRHIKPVQYFYGDSTPNRYLFKQEHNETWDEYWGAVISSMESPDEREEWFVTFQEAHKQRFNDLARDGVITVMYDTEVWLGQPKYI